MAHLVRGVSTEALADTFVKACVWGAINRYTYSEGAFDVSKMREIRDWLKNRNMPYEKKRLLW